MKWNHESDKSMRKGPVVEISMTASWSERNTQILMAFLWLISIKAVRRA